jgi:O-antigen ligase
MTIERWAGWILGLSFAVLPLFGAIAVLVPLHPPLGGLVPIPLAWALLIAIFSVDVAVVVLVLRRPRRAPAMRAGLMANFWATLVAAIFGFDPFPGIALALGVLFYVEVHGAIVRYYARPGVAERIFTIFLASGSAACLFALVLAIARRPSQLDVLFHGRAVGTFLNPSELAEFCLVLFATALGVAFTAHGAKLRALAWVTCVVAFATLVETYARSALVSFAIAGTMLAYGVKRSLTVVAFGCVAIAGATTWAMAIDTHHATEDSYARLPGFAAGVATFVRFPLTGVGPLAFNRTYDVMRAPDGTPGGEPVAYDPHNMALSILAESGIVGFAAIVFGWTQFIILVRRALLAAEPRARFLSACICAGLAATVIHVMLNSVSLSFGIWSQFMALALAAAASGLPEKQHAQA